MTLGQAIAAMREEYGVSLEELSRATRIRASLLRQIEHDDFSGCGGSVYAKGHLRAIATYLDLDPDPLIKQFEKKHDTDDIPAPTEIFEREVIAKQQRHGPNWTAGMAFAAVVLLIVAVFSVISPNETPTGTIADEFPSIAASSPAAETQAPVLTTEPSAGDLTAGLLNDSGVSVRVTVTGTKSWVYATSNGAVLFQRTLSKGETKDLHADKDIALVLGNAGAVSLVVNGTDVGSPGKSGEVVRLTFGPDDPDGAGSG